MLRLQQAMTTAKKTLVASVLLVISAIASADLQDEMDNMMNALTNTSGGVLGNATAAGVYKSASRGVVTGGAIQIRTGIKSANIWQISPPSISAGCGGVDLYGGSISLISKDEFINMLRAIGQNALGYAFKIALETQCPTCSEAMTWLGDKINEYGMMDLNSCRSAQYLVDSLSGQNGQSVDKMQTDFAKWVGYKEDDAATNTSVGGETPLQQAKNSDPDNLRKNVHGNLIWRALHVTNTQGVFSGGDTDLLRAILSMYGTVVVKEKTTRIADGETSDSEEWPALFDAEDLYAGTGTGSDEKEIYTCADGTGEDECLEPSKDVFRIKGMQPRVLEILIGPDGVSGIVGKYARDDAGLTNEEQAFVAVIGPVAAKIEEISRMSHDMARQYAAEVASSLAVYYTDMLVGRVALHLYNAVRMMEHPEAKRVQELVEKRSAIIFQSVREIRRENPSQMSEMLSTADKYLNQRTSDEDMVGNSPAQPN